MGKYLVSVAFCLTAFFSQSQDKTPAQLNAAPVHTWYSMKGAQLIFSKGEVMDNGVYIPNILRFTCFFHAQYQFHYDFAKSIGLYTGVSVINVGFINAIPLPDGSSATLKQSSYSLGIPLGIKLGNMPSGDYLGLGIEGEYMFNYKEKVLYGGNKSVYSQWFSPDVTAFNPSLFVELRFHSGAYIRFKYYLYNFLIDETSNIAIPGTTISTNYTPEKSNLYYVSVGFLLKTKHKHALTKNDV